MTQMTPTTSDDALPDELSLVHPLTGATYVIREAGRITVSLGEASGTYDGVGRWLDGDFLSVDRQMCRWLDSGWLTRGAALNRRYIANALRTDPSAEHEEHEEP